MSPHRTSQAAAFALCLVGVLGGCAGQKPIPAHWVDNARDLEPQPVYDFAFTTLSFVNPREGWIGGGEYLLHVSGGDLDLLFVRRLGWSNAFKATGAGKLTVAASGFRWGERWRSFGVVLYGDHGQWTADDLSSLPLSDWRITALDATDRRFVLALFHDEVPGDPSRYRNDVLRGVAGTWEVLDRPLGAKGWDLADVCIDEHDGAWIVGSARSADDVTRALALRYEDGVLEDRTPPELIALDRIISHVECLPGGKVVMAAGPSRKDRPFAESSLMIRYDGAWHIDWFRPVDGYIGVGGLAAVSDRDVWIASERQEGDRPVFLHWLDGAWTAVEPPPLPDGRTSGYHFTDLEFVSPDEGWATASEGFRRGLIFHYRNGVWRIRNWNWHFWDQPGFGLFGE